MDTYEISVLAEDLSNKRLRREMLAMRNVAGLSPADRAKLEIEYHQADAEFLDAGWRLERAKHRR